MAGKRIAFNGGKQPVKDDAFVEVEYRSGFRARDRGDAFDWHYSDDYDEDIVAFTVIKDA